MMNQYNLWLYPVVVLGAVSLVHRLSLPWKWAWGFVLQSLVLLSLSAVGLSIGPSWLYAIINWALVVVLFFLPSRFYGNLQKHLTALDADKLRRNGQNIRLIFWGMPGEFWSDMAEALACFVERRPEEAERLLKKWSEPESGAGPKPEGKLSKRDDKLPEPENKLPRSVSQVPYSYRLIGNGVLRRWEQIVGEFEKFKSIGSKVPSPLIMSAARAYAELGDFEKATQCLTEARLPESNLPLDSLTLTLLPFFALAGAKNETDALISVLSQHKGNFEECTSLYWKGRCSSVAGDRALARSLFDKALSCSNSDLFRERVEAQLLKIKESEGREANVAPDQVAEHKTIKVLKQGPNENAEQMPTEIAEQVPSEIAEQMPCEIAEQMPSEIAEQMPTEIAERGMDGVGDSRLNSDHRGALVNTAWDIFRRSAFVQELIAPKRKSIAVIAIIVSICLVYLITQAFGEDPTRNPVIILFALIPPLAISGEYWRFVTYLFLHAHITHLAFNVFGLYWFGRVAENIFGTSRFIAIYLVGGLLSGVAHALLSPNLPAVGASGAVMAVFAAVAAGVYRLKDKMPASIWKLELSWLIGLALAQIMLDQIIPQVAVFAHLGGLIAGAAIGMILSLRTPAPDEIDGTQVFVRG